MKKIQCETDWFAHPDEFRKDNEWMTDQLIRYARYFLPTKSWDNFRWMVLKYMKLTECLFDEHIYEGRTNTLVSIYQQWLMGRGQHPFDSDFVTSNYRPLARYSGIDADVVSLHFGLEDFSLYTILHSLLCIYVHMPLQQQSKLMVSAMTQPMIQIVRERYNRRNRDPLEEELFASHERQAENNFCDEFRCVVGNPFRPVTIDPAWRRSVILDLADTIDSGERFDLMPILADALEDAGCHDTDVLSHCRDWKIHSRGCWLIDGLLDGPNNLREPTSGRKSMFDPIP